MLVKMTHVGGPLDGTIEFEEGQQPNGIDAASLAMGTYYLTEGEVGKGAMAASPLFTQAIVNKEVNPNMNGKITVHKYYIRSNELIDAVRYVVADHRPEYRK